MSEDLTSEEIAELEALETRKVAESGRLSPELLYRDTAINPDDLDTSMIRQAGLFAHYAVIAAKSQERAENLKLKRDVLESKIDQEIRDEAASDGKKITEKMIEASIRVDVRWIKVQKELNSSRAEADLAKTALEALRHKRDMMVQLGVNMREEMKGELRIKEIEAGSAKTTSSRERALEIAGQK